MTRLSKELLFIFFAWCSVVLCKVYACSLEDVDFDKLSTVRLSQGGVQLDEIAPTFIWVDSSEGDLRDPALYDRRVFNLNFDGLYRLSNGIHFWYFRFGGQAFNSDQSERTLLYEVQWAGGSYPSLPGRYRLDLVIVPRTYAHPGETGLSMVGDSITWWHWGQYFRCFIKEAGAGYTFVGTRTDVFGYAHDGEGGNTTAQVLKRVSWLVSSDVYFLLIGTNDRCPVDETVTNIILIAQRLRAKGKRSVVLVSTLLPRTDQQAGRVDGVNRLLRERIAECHPYCKLLDLGGEFRSADNWPDLLEEDGLHPTLEGYRTLAAAMVKSLPTPTVSPTVKTTR